MNLGNFIQVLVVVLAASPEAWGQSLRLPTPNRALLTPGAEERYFVGTVGRTWPSGTFGCVRSEGTQLHEGIDIRAISRDRKGEALDPVFATTDGIVSYVNRKASLSNYGLYVILAHQREGIEFYSFYAHLRDLGPAIIPGRSVKAGERLGTLGRTANTKQGISKDRAHVHFELNLRLSERYAAWHAVHQKGMRNDHGDWNGRNFVGFDPVPALRGAVADPSFSLLRYLRSQTELCRVIVRATNFSFARRNPGLVMRNPRAEKEGIAGYEIALNHSGVPFLSIPRAASEIRDPAKVRLIAVNETEARARGCRKLVVRQGGRWELGTNGRNLVSLLLK